MATSIKVENLSKIYRLGEIGTGTISRDIERWYARIRGKEDPFLKIGQTNDRSKKGESDIVYSLQDINFEIEQGDAVGIIGKNGAGKSTLLKILSRVTSPTTGKINIKGRVASLLEVGTGFHPELTGRENIFLNGAILGMRRKEIQRKLDEIIDFSGVERYIDTPVKRYSSGMYVRLAFAVAAHLESEILVVDEVLAVGDAEFQKKCLGKMNDVSKGEGRTVLFVSHNMAAVQSLCNKGIVLQHGIKIYEGTSTDAVSNYQKTNISNDIVISKWSESEAPGDQRAKLLAAEAYPTQGDFIDFRSGVTLKFIVQSNISKSLLDVSFNLKNQEEVLIFHHGNYLTSLNKLTQGIYEMEVEIPPYILNEGYYSVDVWMGLGGIEIIGDKVIKALTFFMEKSNIDHLAKTLPGIIRPKILYNTVVLENSVNQKISD
jgi:lipopolysaccharide transport system ATP-binding protein